MPSAITASIHDGEDLTLVGFIERAAPQGFYGCSKLPLIKNIKDTYYLERVKELKAEIKLLLLLTNREFREKQLDAQAAGRSHYQTACAAAEERRRYYKTVQKELDKWDPPAALLPLKENMQHLLTQDAPDYREPDIKWYVFPLETKTDKIARLKEELVLQIEMATTAKKNEISRINYLRTIKKEIRCLKK